MVDAKIATLLAVAKAKSFTRAAEWLHLTQPAVSQHIKALENEYGVQIFLKNRRDLNFTREGRILHQYARRAADMDKQVREAIDELRSHRHNVRIGVTPTTGESIIPQAIAQYGEEHTDLVIRIYTDSLGKLYKRLESSKLDLVIAEGSIPPIGYTGVLVGADRLNIIVSPRHPFARRRTVNLEDLKKEKLILRSGGSNTRALFEKYLHDKGETLESFHVTMEIDSIAAIKELVARNYGISILAHSACRAEMESGKLVAVAIRNAQLSRNINMVYKEPFHNTDMLEEIRRIYSSISKKA